ncbi:DUF1648 domain-containing protein [Lentibacillus salicampi]|uniref:DUF1648 domain-containing protein n=1 Tax=Lentibacillus salicampi TaxID=175306 RepID=A0A4Y9AIP7_9BACI|nr:DUF1648 domain-containing protein [Lentibacillus salicampi]TFJ94304.1 DUF1648 domain-containing protein [Lentibacillus salicampi]
MDLTQPKIHVPASVAEKVIHTITLLLIIAAFVYTMMVYPGLPEPIPIHFNAQGDVNNWGSKAIIFLLPAISLVLFIGLYFLNKVPHIYNLPVKVTEENASRIYSLARTMMAIFNFEMAAIFTYVTFEIIQVAQGGSGTLGVWFIVAVFLVPLGTIGLFIQPMRHRQ